VYFGALKIPAPYPYSYRFGTLKCNVFYQPNLDNYWESEKTVWNLGYSQSWAWPKNFIDPHKHSGWCWGLAPGVLNSYARPFCHWGWCVPDRSVRYPSPWRACIIRLGTPDPSRTMQSGQNTPIKELVLGQWTHFELAWPRKRADHNLPIFEARAFWNGPMTPGTSKGVPRDHMEPTWCQHTH